jgi:Uncharacterised protein family (UPF0158)
MRRLKIELSELAFAFEESSPEASYFLDLETGAIVLITEESRDELRKIHTTMRGTGKAQMSFAEALRRHNLPDWQQTMLIEAEQVEASFGTRYIRVPEADAHADYRDMEQFIATVQDARMRGRLADAIHGRGAFRRFRDLLADHPHERERWFAFKNGQLRQRALEWLAEERIEVIKGE